MLSWVERGEQVSWVERGEQVSWNCERCVLVIAFCAHPDLLCVIALWPQKSALLRCAGLRSKDVQSRWKSVGVNYVKLFRTVFLYVAEFLVA